VVELRGFEPMAIAGQGGLLFARRAGRRKAAIETLAAMGIAEPPKDEALR
jgi:hypothetical protein